MSFDNASPALNGPLFSAPLDHKLRLEHPSNFPFTNIKQHTEPRSFDVLIISPPSPHFLWSIKSLSGPYQSLVPQVPDPCLFGKTVLGKKKTHKTLQSPQSLSLNIVLCLRRNNPYLRPLSIILENLEISRI